VFRSIYGYTQNVTKKDKKTYQYYREGVIEDLPHIRPGKNSLILPINTEHKLINFFNTGKSTTHNFREKGDWNIDYSIDKVEINEQDIIIALENFIKNQNVISQSGNNNKLINELDLIINNQDYFNKYKKPNKNNLLNKLNIIESLDWFIKCKNKSEFIDEFTKKVELIKNKFNSSIENTNKDQLNETINNKSDTML
jgi:hypothetical protein